MAEDDKICYYIKPLYQFLNEGLIQDIVSKKKLWLLLLFN